MKKLLIVNSFYAPTVIGGAEVSTQLLAEGLLKKYRVVVLTTGPQRKNVIKENINGVEVYRIPCLNIYWPLNKKNRSIIIKLFWHLLNLINPLQFLLIKKLLSEINPDIVHTQNLSGIGTYIWGLSKKSKIYTVHTIRDYSLLTPVKNNIINKMFFYINKKRSENVDYVVGISRFILEKHTKNGFFPNSQEQVIHNIVNSERYQRRQRVEGAPLVIGYFGQLEEIKGIQILVKALRSINPKIVSKLIICGSGELENDLQNEANKDLRIDLKGKLDLQSVYRLMAEVDITIVPSLWEEPFGRVIIESYNQGTPVIAGNIGGIPEVVSNSSFLMPNVNENYIIKFIERFYYLKSDQYQKIVEESYNASEKYRDNISMYLNIYPE